jgi:hypothetical protein
MIVDGAAVLHDVVMESAKAAHVCELLSGAVISPSADGERATGSATVAISDATLISPFALGCM